MIRIIIDHKLQVHTLLLAIIIPILLFNTVQISVMDDKIEKLQVRHEMKLDFLDDDYNDEYARLLFEDEMQINCIALAIYGEARGETQESMTAVAYVIMNRVLSDNRRFPGTPCNVVLQSYQFESVKGALKSMVDATVLGDFQFPFMKNQWISRKIRAVARDVFYYQVPDPTNFATHFWSPTLQFALGRKAPTWSTEYPIVARVGGHIYHE